MSEIWERINTLERNAQRADEHHEFREADELRKQADELRERVKHLDALRAELMAMASDSAQASDALASLWRYSDPTQQLSILAGALYAKKLISQGQFDQIKARLKAPTPSQAKRDEEEKAERERLEGLFARVLVAVGRENRSDAVALYNVIGGPRNLEKMRNWITRLGEKGLLPLGALVVLRYSDWLSKLVLPGEEKMVKGGREDKMLRSSGENK